MNPVFGVSLAVTALVAGYALGGWQGLVLAVTIVAFWLILQFSQVMRVLRVTAQSPVGHVDNAVMLHARLHKGMALADVLRLARSLGAQADAAVEVFAWADTGGDRVEATFERGRLASWQLVRSTDPQA
jgi:hypothetical protein